MAQQQQEAMAGALVEATLLTMYKQAIAKFYRAVFGNAKKAYKDLIHEIKMASLSFVPDLEDADENMVLVSIAEHTAQYFGSDVSIRRRKLQKQEELQEGDAEEWTEETKHLISKMHENAANASHYLNDMHICIAMIREQVSDADFHKILKSCVLPYTTVEVIQREESSIGMDVELGRIKNHFPRASLLRGKPEATVLLGSLVHYLMRQNLINDHQHQIGQERLAVQFRISKSALKRVFTGKKRKGGKDYKLASDAKEKEAARVRREQKQILKATTSTEQPPPPDNFVCKYCGQQFSSEQELDKHEDDHASKVRKYTCVQCTKEFPSIAELLKHQPSHVARDFVCCECQLVCKNAHSLATHAKTHKFFCPFCPKELKSQQAVKTHVGTHHGRPVKVLQCSVCKFVCTEEQEFHAHFNANHRKYKCMYCPLGFPFQAECEEHVAQKHSKAAKPDESVRTDQSDHPLQPAQPESVPEVEPDPEPEPVSGPPAVDDDIDTIYGSPTKPKEGTFSTCQACDVYFSSIQLRTEHIKTYHQDLIKKCKICNTHRFIPTLIRHVVYDHGKCLWCREVLGTLDALKVHLVDCPSLPEKQKAQLKHSEKPAPAKTTEPEATQPEPEPVTTQTETEPVTTQPEPQPGTSKSEPTQAAQGATSPSGRTSRETTHPHACDECGKRFKVISSLNMHINQKHKADQASVTEKAFCPICSKYFGSETSMLQHLEMTHGTPEFYCKIPGCKYFSYLEEDLHRHRRSQHRSDFVYRCRKCPFVSSEVQGLAHHNGLVHGSAYMPEKPGSLKRCTLCSQTFKTWPKFFGHLHSHPQNKYDCDECGFTFSTVSHLNGHCQSAHDTRHFACDLCMKSFDDNFMLTRHLVAHRIKCNLCERFFLNEEKFYRHMRIDHPMDEKTIEEMEEEDEERERLEAQKRKQDMKDRRNRRKGKAEPQKRGRDDDDEDEEPVKSPRKKRRKKKKKRKYEDDDDDDDDDTYTPGADDSEKDPTYRPSRQEKEDALEEAMEDDEEDDD